MCNLNYELTIHKVKDVSDIPAFSHSNGNLV